jgi:biopolymer transport protein ExbB
MKRLIFLSFFIFLSSVSADEPNDLQSLLEQVKKERYQEKEVLAKREAKFKRVNSKQEELLTNALQILSNEETRSTSLRNNYDTQELEIARQNNIHQTNSWRSKCHY